MPFCVFFDAADQGQCTHELCLSKVLILDAVSCVVPFEIRDSLLRQKPTKTNKKQQKTAKTNIAFEHSFWLERVAVAKNDGGSILADLL